MLDTPVPLATVGQFTAGPFANLIANYTPQASADLMIEATRSCEGACDRRLAPFIGLKETHRAEGIDPDEYTDAANLPLDLQGTLGRSYAYALGSSTLVRHCWLNEFAPRFAEMWSYTVQSVTVRRSYGGSQVLTPAQYQGPDVDSGHLFFSLGQFIPVGSYVDVVYDGGYATVPADLRRACIYMAASIVTTELDPNLVTHGHTADDLEAKAVSWLAAYQRS